MSILAPSKQGFHSLLRVAAASVADPLWFAPPVDAEESDDSITIVFHLPERKGLRVRVHATDRALTLTTGGRRLSRRPLTRLCSLPCLVVGSGVETAHEGQLLRVRIPKKRPASDKPDAPSPA